MKQLIGMTQQSHSSQFAGVDCSSFVLFPERDRFLNDTPVNENVYTYFNLIRLSFYSKRPLSC
jgi:hypothetical protein